MKSKDQLLAYLEPRLSTQRLQHSMGVMQTMEKLADVYNLDREQASTAGLLHDVAKELKQDCYQTIVKDAEIEIRCEEDKNYHLYLHGPVGAYLAEKELDIKDPVILKAIKTHTFYGLYNDEFNSPLNWCLHFSDIIEPNRNWSQVKWLHANGDQLAKTIYSGKLEESALLFTDGVIQWFTEDNLPIHPNMYRAHANLSKRVGIL